MQIAQRLHKLPCYWAHFSLWQLAIILKHFKQFACSMGCQRTVREDVLKLAALTHGEGYLQQRMHEPGSIFAGKELHTKTSSFQDISVRHTLGKFCDDAEFLISLEGVQHLDDVLVPEAPQDLDFLSQADNVFLALAMLQDELHSHCLPCPFPSAFINLRST